MIEKITTKNLLDLNQTQAGDLFNKYEYAYEVLKEIREYVIKLGSSLSSLEYDYDSVNQTWISKQAKIHQFVTIMGPTIIGHNTEVRPGAFIRGSVLIGDKCVIGNATEIKNAILFNGVQAPHYNYIGDSVLGHKAHCGAGVILSNLKSVNKPQNEPKPSTIKLKIDNQEIDTNLRKFGAILGDNVEIGCNAVLNPGTIIGRNSVVYTGASVRGYIEPNMILQLRQVHEYKKRRFE